MTTTPSPTPLQLPTLAWGRSHAPRRVLLVHGLGGSGNTWWRVANDLSRRDVQVVAPDLRGHGHAPRASTYGIEDHAADLLAVGTSWHLVVGHSIAGPIVATAAATSGFTRGLLLLDPVFDIDDETFAEVVADQLRELELSAPQLLDAHPEWHPDDRDLKLRASQMTSAFVVERCLTDSAPWHHLELLTDEALPPTTILAADPAVGTMFPPAHAELGVGDRVHCEALPGVGHSIQRERPDRVIQAIVDSLI